MRASDQTDRVKVELEEVCDSLDSAELHWEHGDPSDAALYPDLER